MEKSRTEESTYKVQKVHRSRGLPGKHKGGQGGPSPDRGEVVGEEVGEAGRELLMKLACPRPKKHSELHSGFSGMMLDFFLYEKENDFIILWKKH